MLNEFAKRCYDEAAKNGWHEKEVSLGDCLMNVHSEISEAWEEYREGRQTWNAYHANGKPCGIPIEFADIIIRVLDACEMYGIDIDKAVEEKLTYNRTRGYRHGNKTV